MKRDEFGLKPPNHSYVDMLERVADGVHVDVVDRNRHAVKAHEPEPPALPASGRENSRLSSRSSRGGQD
jgi:hypothetical protein